MAMMDGVHPQSPLGEGFVEHNDCLLQIGDAYVLKFLISGDNVEALGEGRLLRREALLHLGTELGHLIENKFEVWIHSTKLFLLAVSVVDWVQSCAGSRLLIPLVSLSGSMSSKEQGIKESRTKNRKNRGRLGKYSLRGGEPKCCLLQDDYHARHRFPFNNVGTQPKQHQALTH
jgi:hypothetical protein